MYRTLVNPIADTITKKSPDANYSILWLASQSLFILDVYSPLCLYNGKGINLIYSTNHHKLLRMICGVK